MTTKTESDKIFLNYGIYISILTAAITAVTFGIALMTPPLSGPFCAGDCYEYPYTDIISRFPRDYYWMYPTMLISVLFVLLMACIHMYADQNRKVFSLAGVAFATISAAVLIPNYWIQLSVVQPGLINGETDGISLLTQFNPHGVFIALEEIGFLLMILTFLVIIPVFEKRGSLNRAVRLTFLTGFLLVFSALIVISALFGLMREYIFEVAIISIVWIELFVSSILLSKIFYRKLKSKNNP